MVKAGQKRSDEVRRDLQRGDEPAVHQDKLEGACRLPRQQGAGALPAVCAATRAGWERARHALRIALSCGVPADAMTYTSIKPFCV
jgi:hypothetical protein